MSTGADIDWMWCYESPHEAAELITKLRAERDADRGNIRKLLSQQQELLEAILQLAKSSGLPAEMVADYERQCKRSAAAIIATEGGTKA